MTEKMKHANHQQASQLLHNKFVVVLGSSTQRSIYKDLVLLLQKDKYLSLRQLKSKGEMSFEQDCLVEGGCLSKMNNGTDYREVRQFQSDHHLVRFYFVTRIFSRYMQSVIEDFRRGLKPDVVIVNSCVWDISRYKSSWVDDYKDDLQRFFEELNTCLPEETLVVWNLTMPLAERIRGGFLVPEIEFKAPQMRYDVIEANFYCQTVADAYKRDVLDLHFHFRFSLHHRMKDGVHWNAIAHRGMTSLLLEHIAQAWGVKLTLPLITVESTDVACEQPLFNTAPKVAELRPAINYNFNTEEFISDSASFGYLNFEDNSFWPHPRLHEAAEWSRPAIKPEPLLPPVRRHQHEHRQSSYGFRDQPPHHFEPYREQRHRQSSYGSRDQPPHYFEPYREQRHRQSSYGSRDQPPHYFEHDQYVMRSRHTRHHYAPYSPYRRDRRC